jgi:AGZA family xanthine/uracil permease-like MFS transporter
VLGYHPGLLFGTILPAVGVSLVVGNGAYALQAWRLARAEGREDRTALPYGINTVSLFAFVFLVMLPAKLGGLAAGLDEAAAVELSWRAVMDACLSSGLIESSGAFCAQVLQRWLPRAALLSTLAGIALGYISLGFLLRTYERLLVGLAVLSVLLLSLYGRVRPPPRRAHGGAAGNPAGRRHRAAAAAAGRMGAGRQPGGLASATTSVGIALAGP